MLMYLLCWCNFLHLLIGNTQLSFTSSPFTKHVSNDSLTILTSNTISKLTYHIDLRYHIKHYTYSPYWPPIPYQCWLTQHIDLRHRIKADSLTILTSDTVSKLTWPPTPYHSWLTHHIDRRHRSKLTCPPTPNQSWLTHHIDLRHRIKADSLTILTSDTESKLATISSSPTSTSSS